MHTRTPRALVVLSLGVALIAPAIAHADRAPTPVQADAPPPPLPPKPPDVGPVKVVAEPDAKSESPPVDAKNEAKKESGGTCSVGAPAGGWPLLALALLGLRRRRY